MGFQTIACPDYYFLILARSKTGLPALCASLITIFASFLIFFFSGQFGPKDLHLDNDQMDKIQAMFCPQDDKEDNNLVFEAEYAEIITEHEDEIEKRLNKIGLWTPSVPLKRMST